MANDQLKAFLDAVKTDEELQAKLKSAADPEAIVEIAKQAGFSITHANVQEAEAELSDVDLAEVTGGHGIGHLFVPILKRGVDDGTGGHGGDGGMR